MTRGSSANRTVIDRILSHETLQRVYASLPYDIYITAIRSPLAVRASRRARHSRTAGTAPYHR